MAHRILVVDDERTLSELLAEVLDRAGYTVRTAGNAKAARDIAGVTVTEHVVVSKPDLDSPRRTVG